MKEYISARCGVVGENMKLCSACKFTRYCGRSCQEQDWPSHKAACKKKRQGGQKRKELLKKAGEWNYRKILDRWRKQENGQSFKLCLSTFGSDKLSKLIERRQLVGLDLVFDYSYAILVPINLPSIILIEEEAISSGVDPRVFLQKVLAFFWSPNSREPSMPLYARLQLW